MPGRSPSRPMTLPFSDAATMREIDIGSTATRAEILGVVVVEEFEILVREVEDRIDGGIRRIVALAWASVTTALDLLEVIEIEMRITERVDELTGSRPVTWGNHQRQQGVGGDVEGNAEKEIGACRYSFGMTALGDAELEQTVAWSQRHAIQITHVPGTDDEAS